MEEAFSDSTLCARVDFFLGFVCLSKAVARC